MTGWPFEHVFLARHGQTAWNLQGRRQGRLDSPLTPLGLAQAVELGRQLRGCWVDAVLTSPLGRAVATADVVGRDLGLPVIHIPELAEIDHGRWSGLTDDDIDRLYPGALASRAADKYRWAFPDGESYADADRRAGLALARAGMTGSRSPLLITHEMIGRMLIRALLEEDPREALAHRHPHGVVLHWQPGRDRMEPLTGPLPLA